MKASQIGPLGVQTDAIYAEGQRYDFSFHTLRDNAGRNNSTSRLFFVKLSYLRRF